MPAIEVQRLEREFKGGLKAVNGIDLEVAAGEVYGFLGPNGAGKTTTVRMLVTLLRPTGGRALVAGHDVAKEPHLVRKRIRVAPPEAALDLLLTGRRQAERRRPPGGGARHAHARPRADGAAGDAARHPAARRARSRGEPHRPG